MSATLKCSICGTEFVGFGHNPEPIFNYDKRCCDHCNQNVVIPVRIFGVESPMAMKALRKYGLVSSEKKKRELRKYK